MAGLCDDGYIWFNGECVKGKLEKLDKDVYIRLSTILNVIRVKPTTIYTVQMKNSPNYTLKVVLSHIIEYENGIVVSDVTAPLREIEWKKPDGTVKEVTFTKQTESGPQHMSNEDIVKALNEMVADLNGLKAVDYFRYEREQKLGHKWSFGLDQEKIPFEKFIDGWSELRILSKWQSTEELGGDEDEHGCKGSAGYVWCESKQKCIRTFEEDCPPVGQKGACAGTIYVVAGLLLAIGALVIGTVV